MPLQVATWVEVFDGSTPEKKSCRRSGLPSPLKRERRGRDNGPEERNIFHLRFFFPFFPFFPFFFFPFFALTGFLWRTAWYASRA